MVKLIVGVNDLATTHSDLVKEWDFDKNDISPKEVSAGSHKKVFWLCTKGHSYQSTINNRIYNDNGCPYCRGLYAIEGVTDLATTNPDLIKEWDFTKNTIRPTEIKAGSNKKVWWLCKKCNNSWQAKIYNRTLGKGCPYCSGRKVIKGVTDLATVYKELVKEWDFTKNTIRPTEVTAGSNKEVWWLCKEGHSWQAMINDRTSGKGCPYCSGRYSIQGVTDLETTHPELIKEWDFTKNIIRPTEISAGSHTKVWWLCKNNHSWQADIHSRTNGNDCPYCSGQKVLEGYNDLQTTNPELIKEWDFTKNTLKPTEVSAGMNKKIYWLCPKGHSYQSVIYSRKNGTGCPICNRSSISEKLTNDILTELGDVSFKKEWVQIIGGHTRRYDFYLPELQLCIEVDGLQHFEELTSEKFKGKYVNQKRSDGIKNTYLLKLGIPLLRIPGLDTVNTRLKEINKPTLDVSQFKDILKDTIQDFIFTRKIPNNILSIYKRDSETNYYQVALKMNELL